MKRKRNGCLATFLIVFIILNTLGALGYIFWEKGNVKFRHDFPMQPNWYISYLTVACILNVIAGIAVWKWKKWGVCLFVANLALVVFFQFNYSAFWIGCLDSFDMFLVLVLMIPIWNQMD